MFFNKLNETVISGNLIIDISDYNGIFLITPTPIFLQIKYSIVTDKKVIANELNNFFNSIAAKLDTKITQILDFTAHLRIQRETPFLLIRQQKRT